MYFSLPVFGVIVLVLLVSAKYCKFRMILNQLVVRNIGTIIVIACRDQGGWRSWPSVIVVLVSRVS